jgi:hypothetical protein
MLLSSYLLDSIHPAGDLPKGMELCMPTSDSWPGFPVGGLLMAHHLAR